MKTFHLRDKETEQIHADVVEFDDDTAAIHFRADGEKPSYTIQSDSLQRIADRYNTTTILVSTD